MGRRIRARQTLIRRAAARRKPRCGLGLRAPASAVAAAYLVVRTVWHRRPPDETTERIQVLIDEANRLIRTLEDKK